MRGRRWTMGTALAAAMLAAGGAGAQSAPSAPAPPPPGRAPAAPLIPTETAVLPNGLRVVMNVDRSDPVVAVGLVAHVGSGREVTGRTGFAHLFEHLFFLNSENLGPGGLDRLSTRVGGEGANGYTDLDHTVYLQTVPRDALEKMLWAEADKLGYFINTVTPAVVAKEIQVVKNEKRQSYDNQPYGQLYPIVQGALFPPDHPYSWTTIGSLEDLDAATLADVKDFYRRWYVPNNATLVISGDFDPAQARVWVEKYFGEIPRGKPVAIPKPRPARLSTTKRLTRLDPFARLPQLDLVWPSVPEGSRDDAAMGLLLDALAGAPDGPVYRSVVEEAKVSDAVVANSWTQQMAGAALIQVRAFADVPLDRVIAAVDAGLKAFRTQGLSPERLERLKAVQEADLYAGIESVRGKVSAVADSETVRRRPDDADAKLAALRAVTVADVTRAFDRYVDGRPRLELGFVPRDKPALALTGAAAAPVEPEEAIVQGAEAAVDQNAGRTAVARTPSRIDRSAEPPAGPAPVVKVPAIWTATLPDGLAVSGIEDRELPLVRFELAVDGGQLRDDPARPGAASLTAQMLLRGTAGRTRVAFEDALKALGADLDATVTDERTLIRGSVLSRNLAPAVALLTEALTQPRFDASELALAKAAATAGLQASRARPEYLARQVARRAMYGGGILADDPHGTPASVAALTADDLRRFRARTYDPRTARVRFAGAVDRATAMAALAPLAAAWAPPAGPALPPVGTVAFAAPRRTRVLFYDVPGAKQSAVVFARPGPPRAAAEWTDARAANFLLGGGGFASRMTQRLREDKGYTYGVRSSFEGLGTGGRFLVESPVRANVTLEAAALMRDTMRDYGATFTPADLALTKGSVAKARARQFETLGAKLDLLGAVGDYGLPADTVAREDARLAALTRADVQRTAGRYLGTDGMIVVVVGDAATQAKRLGALGYGEPEMVPPLP